MGYRIFETLDREAKYVNYELSKGRSITKIALEDYGYKNESSLRKRLTKGNFYKRIGNKFVKLQDVMMNNNSDTQEIDLNNVQNHSVRQSVRHNVTYVNKCDVEQNKADLEALDVTPSDNVTPIIVDTKYEGLLTNYDVIMQMVDEYKCKGIQVTSSNLIIELPKDPVEARVTFRINSTIYNEFKSFAEENKQFKVKELVSAALKEFVEKYK